MLLLEDDRPLSEFDGPVRPRELPLPWLSRLAWPMEMLTGSICWLPPVLYVGRLERELRPESDIVPEWELVRQLKELSFSVVVTALAPKSWARLDWLSESTEVPGRRTKWLCSGRLRFLGITGLKAVGRISVFSMF